MGLTVRIRYLSALRDLTGRREDILHLDDHATLADLVAWLDKTYRLRLPSPGVMATLNGRGWGQLERGPDTALAEDDEVCLFPVTSGG